MVSISREAKLDCIYIHRLGGSSDPQQIDTVVAVSDLFRADAAQTDIVEERAQKRRKLTNDAAVSLQSAVEFDSSQSVVLANIALDLVCSHSRRFLVWSLTVHR